VTRNDDPIGVACLVCTNRPDWKHWWLHQVNKQQGASAHDLLFINSHTGSIPAKRNALIAEAVSARAAYGAWFDDDDWSSPDRIRRCVEIMERDPDISAVGNVESWFVDSTDREHDTYRGLPRPGATHYHAPEGIIFNGAVFRLSAVPHSFNHALTTGEDTEWLGRWLKTKPNYVILGEPLSLWLCHGKNVTNRANTRTFDQRLPPGLITEEEWKLVPR
jgi:hypothetical protein